MKSDPPSTSRRAEPFTRLYDLKCGIVGMGGERHERPHKPLMLIAALDLIDRGQATPTRIPWNQELRTRFSELFELVRRHNDSDSPELPYFHLKTDGFWKAWIEEDKTSIPLQTTPLINQSGKVFASFTEGFESLISIPENRLMIREALISRYFPHCPQIKNLSAVALAKADQSPVQKVAEEEIEYGRSPAFRRKIIEIYDHQCAACGLRIVLPIANGISFIDAAHLIPFSESRNDHPTNGLALCKNHHWAMDRDLIAPGPDHHWHVSRILDTRRSNGEKELIELGGKSLLLPKDEAFHPDKDGLEWRCEKLMA